MRTGAATARANVHPAGTLTAASVRGSGWLLLSTGATAILQLVSAAVLGRLLTPHDFGVVAAAMIVMRVVYYFSQFGLGSALVQKPELSGEDIAATAWLSITVGAAATAVGVLAAPLLADLLNQPEAVDVARVLCVSFVLAGVATTPTALLRRDLRFRAVAVVEVLSYAVGYLGVGVVAVLAGAGLWSLVLASLAQGAVQAVACTLLAPHQVALRPRWRVLAPLARFGGQVSVIGLLEFWSLQLDTVGVSRGRGAADLGHYTRGTLLAYPVVQAALVLARVLISAFARVPDLARLRSAYADALVLVATGALVSAAVLAGGHDALVLALLGSQWTTTAGLLPWLAAASALQALSQLPAVLCESRGVLRPKVWIQLAVLAAFTAAVSAAVAARAPLWCYAAAWCAAELVRQLLYVVVLARRFGIRPLAVARDVSGAALPAAVTLVGIAAVDMLLERAGAPLAGRLAAVLVLAPALPVTVIAVRPGSRFRQVVRDRHLVDSVPCPRPARRVLTTLFA